MHGILNNLINLNRTITGSCHYGTWVVTQTGFYLFLGQKKQ